MGVNSILNVEALLRTDIWRNDPSDRVTRSARGYVLDLRLLINRGGEAYPWDVVTSYSWHPETTSVSGSSVGHACIFYTKVVKKSREANGAFELPRTL